MRPCETERGAQRTQYVTTFVRLWALAHLIHVWRQAAPSGIMSPEVLAPWGWVVLGAAAAVFYRPHSALRLGLLALCQITAAIATGPHIANHWLLAALVNTALVIALLEARKEEPTARVSFAVSRFEGTARSLFLITYAAAALSKLNTGFLDPKLSCAATFAGGFLAPFGSELPVAATMIAISLTMALELAIPLLLCVRRTRVVGICVAGSFHLVLALAPPLMPFDFTALLFALLVLFAPSSAIERAASPGSTAAPLVWLRAAARGRERMAWALGAMVAAILIGFRGAIIPTAIWTATTTILAALALGSLLLSFLKAARGEGLGGAGALKCLPANVLYGCLLGVALITAAAPYVGLHTAPTFTMFSNLRTELGETNHLFLPRAELFNLQDQRVEIIHSDDPALAPAAESGLLLHEVEVWRRHKRNPDETTRIRRIVGGAGGELMSPSDLSTPPMLVRIFFAFRPAPARGDPACRW